MTEAPHAASEGARIEYATVVLPIDATRGQHPNFPHDPFRAWTDEGWRLVTATIRVNGGTYVAGEIVALLERRPMTPPG